ncbi:MAG: glutathione-dependent disulfide-bond oxidoreductase [Novosphingobium sp.]
MAEADYVPPRVWTWDQANGGDFAAINRPIAGATHDTTLRRGAHPFQLYSLGTPNGQKVTILFEELLAAGHTGAEYDAWLIRIMERDQFGSGFVAVNPNSKIPVLLDCSGAQPVRVFESGAILLHLAEKFGAFIPSDAKGRAECLSWLFWQVSTAPIIGNGFGHFYRYAPEKFEYPINRFAMEVKRLLDVADRRLGEARYFAGDAYTIADIAIYGWFGAMYRGEAYDGASDFLGLPGYTNVVRWTDELGRRTGVRRGIRVNREAEGYARERHSAADIDAVMPD